MHGFVPGVQREDVETGFAGMAWLAEQAGIKKSTYGKSVT